MKKNYMEFNYAGKDSIEFIKINVEDNYSDIKLNDTEILKNIGNKYTHLNNSIISPNFPGIFNDGNWLFDYVNYAPYEWNNTSWMNTEWIFFDNDTRKVNIWSDLMLKTNKLKGNYFFIDDFISHINFGHFVHDLMPSIEIYDHLTSNIGNLIPVFRKKFKYDNQIELFEKLFRPLNECFFIEGPTKFENLYVPHRQQNFGDGYLDENFKSTSEFNISGINYAREKIGGLFKKVDHPNFKFIYLYRANNTAQNESLINGRNFTNLSQLDTFLLNTGFIMVDPAFLNCNELHSLLSNSEILVSVHGAGLANLIFAGAGAKIIEIRPSTGVWRSLELVSHALGNPFFKIVTKPTDTGQFFSNDFFEHIKKII